MKIQTILLTSLLVAGSSFAKPPNTGIASVVRGMVSKEIDVATVATILADRLASGVPTDGQLLGKLIESDTPIFSKGPESGENHAAIVRRNNLQKVDTVNLTLRNKQELMGREVVSTETLHTSVKDLEGMLRSTAPELLFEIEKMGDRNGPRPRLETVDVIVTLNWSRDKRLRLTQELDTSVANQKFIAGLDRPGRDTAFVVEQAKIARAQSSETTITREPRENTLDTPGVYRVRMTGTLEEIYKRIAAYFTPAEGTSLDPILTHQKRGEVVGVMRSQDANKYRVTRFADAIDEHEIDTTGMKSVTDVSLRTKLTIVPNETFITQPSVLGKVEGEAPSLVRRAVQAVRTATGAVARQPVATR